MRKIFISFVFVVSLSVSLQAQVSSTGKNEVNQNA
jgi:hypothetical protein